MPQDLAVQSRPASVATDLLSSLSKSLKAATDDPMTPSYSEDGAVMTLRPGTWTCPPVTAELQAEARTWLAHFERGGNPPGGDVVKRWLVALGNLVAGKTSAEDAAAKVSAFASMLVDYPAHAFTKASLDKAGRKFKWLPSYAELTEFLDAEVLGLRTRAQRMHQIISGPAGKPGTTWGRGEAEAARRQNAAEQRSINARVIAELRAKGEWREIPVQEPGESGSAYVTRLREFCDALPGPESLRKATPASAALQGVRRRR